MIEYILKKFKEAKKDKDIRDDNETDYWSYTRGIFVCEKIVQEAAEEFATDTNVGDKWIPVETKLPEYNENAEYYPSVIVTLDTGRVAEGCYRVYDEQWWVDAEDGEHYSINATGHVIAWQPLPAPYQKGE